MLAGGGWGGASPGGLGGEPGCRQPEGGEGVGKPRARETPPAPYPARSVVAPQPPAGASLANQKRKICIIRHAPPTLRPVLLVRMVSTPPRRGGKEKAPKWRGRGTGREGRRELGVELPGRKDGEGHIDSNPNNNKAFKGRRRPALRLSFSEVFGSRARAAA